MNLTSLMKGLTSAWFHQTPLPPAPNATAPRIINGRFAYLCLEPNCQTISEQAPRGQCEGCQSENIKPVQDLLMTEKTLRVRRRIREIRHSTAHARAMAHNPNLYLTSLERE